MIGKRQKRLAKQDLITGLLLTALGVSIIALNFAIHVYFGLQL